MTEAEAIAAIGMPPGNYASSTISYGADEELVHPPPTSPARVISWTGNRHALVVWLDATDRVVGKRLLLIER